MDSEDMKLLIDQLLGYSLDDIEITELLKGYDVYLEGYFSFK